MAIPPIIFGRTQQAIQTPFEPLRNPGFGGLPSSFTSTDVQNAIEEGLQLAVANDRFVVLPFYNGNANTGRYLEIWPGIATDVAPLGVGTSVKCLFVNTHTTSVNATCTVGFYNIVIPASPVLLFTQTLTAQKEKIDAGTPGSPLFTLPATGQLAIKIDSGSINRPYVLMSLSASI
jgi:hypothetical protein